VSDYVTELIQAEIVRLNQEGKHEQAQRIGDEWNAFVDALEARRHEQEERLVRDLEAQINSCQGYHPVDDPTK
jgi:hypothetical protein